MLALIALRVTKLVSAIPNVVVVGFVNGIALLIVLQQFRTFDRWEDIALTVATAAVALLLEQVIHNEAHIAWKLLASTTSVVVLMSIIAGFIPATFLYPDQIDTLTLGTFSSLLAAPAVAGIPVAAWATIILLAVEVALIGLFDTLLTSILLERQTKKEHHYDREVVGQSLALAGVGAISGIPAAQSTVPSMMYFQEGARGRASRVMLVVLTIALLLLSSRIIHFIPDAVLSGIIIKIAWDIADMTSLRDILTQFKPRDRGLLLTIAVGTTIATIIFSLNAAVIGFAVAFIVANRTVFKKDPVQDVIFHDDTQGLADEI